MRPTFHESLATLIWLWYVDSMKLSALVDSRQNLIFVQLKWPDVTVNSILTFYSLSLVELVIRRNKIDK